MDPYEILGEIGNGSFGKIHKVMARKEMRFGGMNEKEKAQLVTEVNILRRLKHPNIVRYYDRRIDSSSMVIYIFMEYCAAGDLSNLIARAKTEQKYLNEELIWKIFIQILCGLHECHHPEDPKVKALLPNSTTSSPENSFISDSCVSSDAEVASGAAVTHLMSSLSPAAANAHTPVLHRDLKPDNIFLDAAMNAKIGDFGLSKVMSSAGPNASLYVGGKGGGIEKSFVGTPYYMAPETIQRAKYSMKSDIWSLGCILYEMCALRPPFEARTQVELCEKIHQGRVLKIPAHYSEDLGRLIRGMLQLDPDKRPLTSDFFALPHIQFCLKERKLSQRAAALKLREEILEKRTKELERRSRELERREADLRSREDQMLQLLSYDKENCSLYSNQKATDRESILHKNHLSLLFNNK